MKTIVDRASRLGALLLAAVLTLSVLPMNALADDEPGEITVADAAALTQAVASEEYDIVRLSASIELTAPLRITGKVKLDLDGFKLSSALDPDTVGDPLATVIMEKKAKLTVTGKEGSELAPPVLPEDKTGKCYGIYVNEKASLALAGYVQVKTDDDTSYMVFMLSDSRLTMRDNSQILGGLFGVKIPSGTNPDKLAINTAGSISSVYAISKASIPFAKIIESDCKVYADGEVLTDFLSPPDPLVSTFVFAPGEAEIPPLPEFSPIPIITPPPEPTATPTAEPTATPTPTPSPTPTASPTASPEVDPTAPTDLPATTAMSWDGTTAMWRAVPGAAGYLVQLYFNGTGNANKLGDAVSVTDTAYGFASLMTADGSYYFTVQAFAEGVTGAVSAPSRANVIDTTAPKITSKAPVRHDAKRATFYFTSSEAGDYYFIVTAADAATPTPDAIIHSADVFHGACTAAEQEAIAYNGIDDSGARSVFLVVVDQAGNASNSYKISIPAYTAPTASPSPTPTPTPKPKPSTFTVTANNGTGYNIVLVGNSKTKVESGGSFSFTVSLLNGYTYGSGFAVKANNKTLSASAGVYTIKNITSDQTVTVTGVVSVSTPVPTAIPSGPSITTTLLPSATMGKSYSQQLTASGGTPITWSYTGSLPNGVTLTYAGLLSGTPSEEGTFRITIKASNTTGSATRQMTLVVTSAEYTVVEGANASWTRGTEGGLTFQGSGNSDFTVRVDGSVVPADKVEFSADRRSVTISAEYLETLSAGSHTLTLLYPDGNAKARFNIKAAERVTAPSITAQPQNTSVLPGGDATFTVTSGGTAPLQCTWQVDKNDGSGWQDIPGADSASYTVRGAAAEQNGWKFRCVITNAAGSAESNAAALTVGDAEQPGSGQEPAGKTSHPGRIILFSLLGVSVVGLGTGAYLFFRRRDEFYDDDDE